jgi:hypothetical protein
MRWIGIVFTALVVIALAGSLAGCGNVYLSGDAMTCTEMSVADAFNAAQRAETDANIPNWTKSYLDENFKQWRSYLRSAKKDMTWGPQLPEEKAVGG